MNRVKRYVAAEIVGEVSMSLIHAQHAMWRASHIFRDGLTPKEIELLERKTKELGKDQVLMSKLAHRLRQSGQCT